MTWEFDISNLVLPLIGTIYYCYIFWFRIDENFTIIDSRLEGFGHYDDDPTHLIASYRGFKISWNNNEIRNVKINKINYSDQDIYINTTIHYKKYYNPNRLFCNLEYEIKIFGVWIKQKRKIIKIFEPNLIKIINYFQYWWYYKEY